MPAEYYKQYRGNDKRSGKGWTNRDDTILILCDEPPFAPLCKKLGRSLQSIHCRRSKIGLAKERKGEL